MQFDPSIGQDLTAANERMKRLARALLGDAHDAEDVAQEAWARAIQGGATPQDGDAWLSGVARNVAREHRRAGKRRVRREAAAAKRESQSPDQLALDHIEAVHSLVEVVRSLPQPYRSALVLQYVVGVAPAEAAEALGVNRATLRSRVHRGLEMVRAELERRSPDDRSKWRLTIAPLVASGAKATLGGLLVSKATSLVGVALLLLFCAGGAALWMYSADPNEEVEGTAQPDEIATQPVAPPLPSLQGQPPPGAPPPPPRPAAKAADDETRVGDLVVFVADEKGAAIASAHVRVLRDGQRTEEGIESPTRNDGSIRFDGLPAGGYNVQVRKDGFTTARRTTNVSAPGKARVNVTLPRAVVVRGRVVRTADGEPIAGAHVSVTRGGSAAGRTVFWSGEEPLSKTTTAADGSFRMEVPAEKLLTLLAAASGMAEASASILLSGPSQDVVLRLGPGGTIKGRVLTSGGDPCTGARIFAVPADQARLIENPRLVLLPGGGSFWSNDDGGGGSAEIEAEGNIHRARRSITDAEGWYELANLTLPAQVRVLAEGPEGSRGGTRVIVLDESSPQALGDVMLEPRAVLAVRVVDPKGQPHTTCTVAVEGVSGSDEVLHFLEPRGDGAWSDFTGAHAGVFRFEGLAIGTYVVVIQGAAGEVRTPVEILKGGEREITVRVEAAPVLQGVVVDEQGRSIPGAAVRWGDVAIRADDEGRFRIEGAGDADRILEATSKWHLPARLPIPSGVEPIRVVLNPRPVVTGVLVPPDEGESLRDHIWIVERSQAGKWSRTGTVDRKGRFRYPLTTTDADTWILLLPRGAADVLLGTFNLSAGEEKDVGQVQLDMGRTLRGQVVDEDDRPVSGAVVRAGHPGLLDLRHGMVRRAPEATTSTDGSFEIQRVHHGHLSVRVRHATHAPTLLRDPPGQGLRVVLSPASFVEGTVRGPDGEPQAGVTVAARPEVPRVPVPGISARTDDQGYFRIGPLAAGEHPLTAHWEKEQVDLGTVVLRKGQTTVRNVTLP